MNSTTKYWKIECAKHLSILFQTKVNAEHLPEKNLIEFIRTLMSKYALSDNEILEQCIRQPFKTSKDYIIITRSNSKLNEDLSISFMSQIADISISAWLSD